MGGPKALLEHGGRSLLAQHVDAFAALGIPRYVVVRPELVAHLRGSLGDAVLVESDADFQSGSLARALAVLPAELERVFVTPVDLPPPARSTLLALEAALGDAHDAVTPRYRGKGGHPVLLRPRSFAALLRSAEPPSLRSLLEAMGARRLRVDVDDPHVVHDFDTPRQARDAGITRPW